MESMRRLNFGHHKHAEFTAHVHILDLQNVPLVEGDCRIKWRFQGGMSLNTTNNEKVMGQALQTSISYLKDLRNAAAGISNDDKGGAADYGDEGDGDHSLGGRFKDAISHASRTLRASTLSHGSGDHLSPRSRSQSMPRSSNGHHTSVNPTSPTSEASQPTWRTSPPADYFRQGGGEDTHDTNNGKLTRPAGSQSFFGGATSASPPTSPQASALPNHLLSPTSTVRPSGSPRQPTALLSPTTPPARPRQSTTGARSPSYNNNTNGNLSRKNIALPNGEHDASGHPVIRSPSSLVESLHKANLPTKAEVKGKTAYMPLIDYQVRFDKHMVCAVAIPMRKHSKHLDSSIVKLKVLYKVRTTPLPERIGSRPAPASVSEDGVASPINPAIRNHKTRINGSSVSISTPVHSGVSTLHINAKEAHEEICLGELLINLSEFVSVDFDSEQMRLTGNGQTKETWITRRYLLQNGKTNALLRVAVKMDWISGVRDFTAPPLMKGQIISPKKQSSRGNDKNRDKEKDKSSLYSGSSANSSRMYMQGANASSRSFISAEHDAYARPLSLRNPLYGKNGILMASPDDVSDSGSFGENGHHQAAHSQHHHHHHFRHYHPHLQMASGFDFGLDDEQADIDIINDIFARPDTPPPAPRQLVLGRDRGYSANDGDRLARNTPHEVPLHSNSNLSELSHKSQHHSPAQALAFLHRSKDKSGKGKQASTSHLGVDESKGRKRISSAPSKSIFPPLRSNSRVPTPVPTGPDVATPGDGNDPSHRHSHQHHHHEHDGLGPVLVHIPTRQEEIDIHSHPFRWKGKPTPGMRGGSHASHTIPSLTGEDDSGYGIPDHHVHREATIDVASLELAHDHGGLAHAGDEKKRRATTSVAAQIFKLPFRNRSTSNLSTSSSLHSAPPVIAENDRAETDVLPNEAELGGESASKASSDMPRGSLDLQKTLRPSSDGDPTRNTLRRMTSPTPMTPAEEANLQLFIKQSMSGGVAAPARGGAGQDGHQPDMGNNPSISARGDIVERRQSVSHLRHEVQTRSRRSSQASSSGSSGSGSSLGPVKLARQPTNELELDERARRLRERGLLPSLSITTSDELPARSPT